MRTFLRIVALLVVIAVALPFALIVVYAVVPPPSTLMIARWIEGAPVDRRWMPLDAIAPDLARAVIVSEDARFCFHYGVDLEELNIVLGDLAEGRTPRGASTITMQTVKNLMLWPQRSYLRKAIEVPLALWMDLVLSKDRILEIYLNIAQWGPGVFGAEAAARHHFGKPASALTRSEAIRLAAALPSPGTRNPARPGPRHLAQVRRVERELARSGWVFHCLPPAIDPHRRG